jgi:hypothetical protein
MHDAAHDLGGELVAAASVLVSLQVVHAKILNVNISTAEF